MLGFVVVPRRTELMSDIWSLQQLRKLIRARQISAISNKNIISALKKRKGFEEF